MNWWSAFTLGLLSGGAVVFIISLILREERDEEPPQKQKSDSRTQVVMTKAVQHRLTQGPEIVAIGGGTGLSTLLLGLKAYTRNITAVVTVTDEGGSSGRLRNEWGVLPPGDIRNCLVSLAEYDSSLNSILNFRFDRGELAGHNLGNLILLATTEMTGDFRLAVEELNHMLAIRGRVLPVTTEAVTIAGKTGNGEILRGELEITGRGADIQSVWIEPRDARPVPDVLAAFETAEIVVLGPGSLFTSILPNLLIRDVSDGLSRIKAPIVYIVNLMTQPGETPEMNILDHVKWIRQGLGRYPDYVIANTGRIPDRYLEVYRAAGADVLTLDNKQTEALKASGCTTITGDFVHVTEFWTLRHHTQKLAETIVKIVREVRENR
ncbi:MAG: uridine diphosphate-N-acetylglucosamine-binding protein YvcK [Thermovirgaceae bacterium]